MKIFTFSSILFLLLVQPSIACSQIQHHIFDFYTAEDVHAMSAIDEIPALYHNLQPLTLLPGFNVHATIPSLKLATTQPDTLSLHDTLVIGYDPGEILTIQGTWEHDGPIVILNDGELHFTDAEATIYGDIYTLGDARMVIENSTIHFPQAYFYERTLVFTGNTSVHVFNSLLDFGGLVHSFVITDQAEFICENMEKPDFSTIGIYNSATLNWKDSDGNAEFIITDSTNIYIENSDDILLWHHVGDNENVTTIFPDGEYVENYEFMDSMPGIIGIDYTITLKQCEDVMWALMPASGSEIHVANSELRAIGLWFEGSNEYDINGLVNNSHYSNYLFSNNDISMQLIDCEVTTWSIYAFDSVIVNVSGCILGEIGVMNNSTVNAESYALDGSGGYIFATDTTALTSVLSSLFCPFRTSKRAIAVMAYSQQMNGRVEALGESLIAVIQSQISEEPYYEEKAALWRLGVWPPSYAYINSLVPITGNAWIKKGALSEYMSFEKYLLEYKVEEQWVPVGPECYEQVFDGELGLWDTHNLLPGSYTLRLSVTDDWGNILTAEKQIVLKEDISAVPTCESNAGFLLLTNPVKEYLTLTVKNGFVVNSININSLQGNSIFTKDYSRYFYPDEQIKINMNHFSPGVFIITVATSQGTIVKKFLVQ